MIFTYSYTWYRHQYHIDVRPHIDRIHTDNHTYTDINTDTNTDNGINIDTKSLPIPPGIGETLA